MSDSSSDSSRSSASSSSSYRRKARARSQSTGGQDACQPETSKSKQILQGRSLPDILMPTLVALFSLTSFFAVHLYFRPEIQDIPVPGPGTRCMRYSGNVFPVQVSEGVYDFFHDRRSHLENMIKASASHGEVQGLKPDSVDAKLVVYCTQFEARASRSLTFKELLELKSQFPWRRVGTCMCEDLAYEPFDTWCPLGMVIENPTAEL